MHILFADDEKNLQELMRTELPRMGYSVTVCPDGLTAVAALEKEPFDCLLVDLDMPGMNGIDVIGKARELRPEIEAVVMTGKPSQGDRDRGAATSSLRLSDQALPTVHDRGTCSAASMNVVTRNANCRAATSSSTCRR